LNDPTEERERTAACRKVRARLQPMMESCRAAAYRLTHEPSITRSAENLAALMAPDEASGALLQKREDSDLRHLARLTETFMKVRQGRFALQNTKNEGRSHDLHENTVASDKVTDHKTTDCPISDECLGQ
jgi:hypothetical protein